MNKKQGTVKVGKALSYIAIVLVVVAVCGFFAYFTGGFTSDFKTFYVTVDGKEVLSNTSDMEIATDKPLEVAVKYTFSAVNKEVSGYSLKVVPTVVSGKDFDFTIDGSAYSFQAEQDLTLGFDIESGENSFTIKPKGGITEILSSVYPNNQISDLKDKAYPNMFTLIVTSYNEKASVFIKFSVIEKLAGITLDQEVMQF